MLVLGFMHLMMSWNLNIYKILKFDFLKNEKSFWSEIKNIFPSFTRALFWT